MRHPLGFQEGTLLGAARSAENLGTGTLCKLHGRHSYATRSGVDEYAISRLYPAQVQQAVSSSQERNRQPGCLLETDLRRFLPGKGCFRDYVARGSAIMFTSAYQRPSR